MLKKFPDAKKFFLVSLALCLSIWFLFSLFFLWVSLSGKQADAFRYQVISLSSRKDEIRTLAKEIRSLGDNIDRLNSFLVGSTQEEIVQFIETVESLSTTSGANLDISSVKVLALGEETLAENFEFLELKLKTLGSWQNIFHFLNLLESLPYNLVISQANLSILRQVPSPDKGAGKQEKWEGDFLLKVAKFK